MSEKHPVFPETVTALGPSFSVEKRGSQVVYLSPEGKAIAAHSEGDLQAFRAITSELHVFGHFKQVDIVRVFGVSAASVRAAVKLYLAHGARGFYDAQGRKDCKTKTGSVKEQIRQIRLEGAAALAELVKDREARVQAVKDGRLRNFTDRWEESTPE